MEVKMIHPGKWRWMVRDLHGATVRMGTNGTSSKDAKKKCRAAQLEYAKLQKRASAGIAKTNGSSNHMRF